MKKINYKNLLSDKEISEFRNLIGMRVFNILFINSNNIDANSNPKFERNSFFSNSLTRIIFWDYPHSNYYILDIEIESPPDEIHEPIQLLKVKRFGKKEFTPGSRSFYDLFHDGLKVDNTFTLQIGSPKIQKIEIYGIRTGSKKEDVLLKDSDIIYNVNIDSLILFYLVDGGLFLIKGDNRTSGTTILLVSSEESYDYITEEIITPTNEWGDKIYTLIHSIE